METGDWIKMRTVSVVAMESRILYEYLSVPSNLNFQDNDEVTPGCIST